MRRWLMVVGSALLAASVTSAPGHTPKPLMVLPACIGYAQVLEEHVSQNSSPPTLHVVYTYGLMLISQDRLVGTSGPDVRWVASFFGYDGHNNVRYLTDTADNITDTFDYDAFGNLISRTGDTPNNYLYCGEQFDPDLGLYFLRARYLNPDTGRFWTQDPFEGTRFDPSSLHKYLYCGNDPVNCADPTGQLTISEVILRVQVWALTLTLTYPTWSRAILFVANMLAPAEVQFGLPWLPAARGLPLREAYVRAKEALNLRIAWEFYKKRGQSLPNIKIGLNFQQWCGQVLNLAENKQAYRNGEPVAGRPAGSVVPDFTTRGEYGIIKVIESKTATASAIQAEGFAEIGRKQGVSVNYIFLVKPDADTVEHLKKACAGVELTIHWLFSNAKDAR